MDESAGTASTPAPAEAGDVRKPAWKNPSAADCQKYNLRPLPDNFEPTPEELALLEMYEVKRTIAKSAARFREEAARAKLAARQAEFQQKQQPSRRKRRADKAQVSSDRDDDDDEDDDEEDEDDSEEDNGSEPRAAVEKKLENLQEEVEETKRKLAEQEGSNDALRAEMMETADDDDSEGFTLLRKKKKVEDTTGTSLIENIKTMETPPHDFSKQLGLTPIAGTVLFPTALSEESTWVPPDGVYSPNEGAFEADLEEFDILRSSTNGNNTLAIKFSAPADSKRFSLNIAEKSASDDYESILFHFNPRLRQRGGQLVINDKVETVWGRALTIPLTQVPLMFGQPSVTLMIQINEEGFDVFVEGKHCARLEHRSELPSSKTTLVVQFPSTDDSGKKENWTVFKVRIMLLAHLSECQQSGSNNSSSVLHSKGVVG